MYPQFSNQMGQYAIVFSLLENNGVICMVEQNSFFFAISEGHFCETILFRQVV